MKKKYHHLSFEERFVIEKLYGVGVLIRNIAEFLGRSPNTVSSEIKRNSVNGVYEADKAKHKAYAKRWRAKKQCLKVAINSFLCLFVEEKLEKKWSPKQISGYLKREYGIICSAKAIYKFAESRGLDHLLFWGWNNHKGGRKRGRWKSVKDGRIYIDERPEREESGHFEIDFIVSKESRWVLLVAVDRFTKRTWVLKLPNRKRDTVRAAFSRLFHGVDLKSIATDNDIAFTCWRELEVLIKVQIYFTHPYHSWEKGLVENTNRWIRCFVPKRRDIGTVTEEEIKEILSFLNDRPREVPAIVHNKVLP
ncbi:MAG: IS30 family transposase [Patescibacteria group bacterium]|nr:IS30 family transposase [Patescibacteria group bacterium]MDE1988436.1 IS30 family transposase [Patescibacteria group bacterium]MDE2218582.1 IS30 family transposase [Patescibacteria group bacterium]